MAMEGCVEATGVGGSAGWVVGNAGTGGAAEDVDVEVAVAGGAGCWWWLFSLVDGRRCLDCDLERDLDPIIMEPESERSKGMRLRADSRIFILSNMNGLTAATRRGAAWLMGRETRFDELLMGFLRGTDGTL